MELVSVCVPTYNGARYLRECLDSIVAQSHYNIEIIIIDDCSSDNTIEIIQEYIDGDDRVKFYQNKKNKGLVGNWQECVKKSNGSWIKFLFQDDILLPNCIEVMLACASASNCPFSVCRRNFMLESNIEPRIRKFFENDVIKFEQLVPENRFIDAGEFSGLVAGKISENFIGEPTTYLFKKEVIKKYGDFNADLGQMVDYEFAVRIALNVGVVFIPEVLAYFRIHSGAESNKNRGDSRSKEKEFKIEFIDPLLLLHSFKYEKSFAVFNEQNHDQVISDKYKAEILKGTTINGLDKMLEKVKPFFKRYSHLEEDIKVTHANHEAAQV